MNPTNSFSFGYVFAWKMAIAAKLRVSLWSELDKKQQQQQQQQQTTNNKQQTTNNKQRPTTNDQRPTTNNQQQQQQKQKRKLRILPLEVVRKSSMYQTFSHRSSFTGDALGPAATSLAHFFPYFANLFWGERYTQRRWFMYVNCKPPKLRSLKIFNVVFFM